MTASFIALTFVITLAAEPSAEIDYVRDVKPVLARCYACHGALKSESGLRLDTVAAMIAGGDSGPAVTPGDSAASLIVQRVSDANEETRMPPSADATALNEEEIAKLSAWIDAGAPAPANDEPEPDPREHWAFQPPVRGELPAVNDESWIQSPIDHFIAAEHATRGLTPAPPADPKLLLRRLYIDLVGMPPTLEEIAAFEADPSDEHYRQIVDSLLNDPRYAERWGRHWMDIWRYSDWWGLGAEVRNSSKHMWHWRDWVIESLQADVGYDEMVRQMLAADELYPDDVDRLRATGFLVRNYFRFNRDTWLDETVEHTSKSLLGLTVNCSRCHDHKYDPLTQEGYYRLRAFFEPYEVRIDLVAGLTEVETDGIPRIFDCHLDAPTYLFVRGNAKQPVTDNPLSPDVPAIVSTGDLVIEPVELPAVSHQPGLRPWVVEAYLAQAEQVVESARAEVESTRVAVAEARQRETSATVAEVPMLDGDDAAPQWLLQESFDALNADVWETQGGEWVAVDGRLEQRATPMERRELRLRIDAPSDLEAVFQFTITGGSMWRSVGIAFDSGEGTELLAYVSAYAGGQKVQISPMRNGASEFPADGAQSLTLGLNEPVELRVLAQGELINVDVNGHPLVAWRSTIGRRAGALKLITFDAQAAFDQFDLRALPAGAVLRSPAGDPGGLPTLAMAEVQLTIAERKLVVAELQRDAVTLRADADVAKWMEPDADDAEQRIQAACRAERQIVAAEADVKVAEIELTRATMSSQAVEIDQALGGPDIETQIAQVRDTAAQAHAAIEVPGTEYTSLRGAFKTIESPTETTESLMAPFPTTSTGRRTALANWITDERNPLTARVAVNHIWSRHFGVPLVPTVFDFGRKGQPPTHPALLDWLAVEFMEHGWSQRHLHRLLVTSATYRMTSSTLGNEANIAIDAENRFLWRMNPTRMESQVVRDSLLHLSGVLDSTMGGPSIPIDQANTSTRRSIYFFHSHNEHDRFLSMFDDAAVQECYRREQSIVPQQALALSNSSQAIEASRRISTTLNAAAPDIDDAGFIRAAFRIMLGCDPTPEEMEVSLAAFEQWRTARGAEENADNTIRELFILALINHNDFVTVR